MLGICYVPLTLSLLNFNSMTEHTKQTRVSKDHNPMSGNFTCAFMFIEKLATLLFVMLYLDSTNCVNYQYSNKVIL